MIASTVAVSISMMAKAFASCNVTKAVLPLGETEIYSGSRSTDALLPGKIRTPSARRSFSRPLNALKSAVLTVALATPPEMSMMLMVPQQT